MLGIRARRTVGAAVNRTAARSWGRNVVAPRHGFEPRFTAPKAAVLPLDDRGIVCRPLSSLTSSPARLQCSLLESLRKPFLAGAGRGLQTRCAVLCVAGGFDPHWLPPHI